MLEGYEKHRRAQRSEELLWHKANVRSGHGIGLLMACASVTNLAVCSSSSSLASFDRDELRSTRGNTL